MILLRKFLTNDWCKQKKPQRKCQTLQKGSGDGDAKKRNEASNATYYTNV